MCLCFLRVRTVYELCQGELILDVANYDYANVFLIHPKRGRCCVGELEVEVEVEEGPASSLLVSAIRTYI